MKSLHAKLVLSALGIALLATPAFAQRPHRQVSHHQQQQQTYTPENNSVGTYPNGATKSGSAESVESGADFNLLR
jgi:hypothetical protein